MVLPVSRLWRVLKERTARSTFQLLLTWLAKPNDHPFPLQTLNWDIIRGLSPNIVPYDLARGKTRAFTEHKKHGHLTATAQQALSTPPKAHSVDLKGAAQSAPKHQGT